MGETIRIMLCLNSNLCTNVTVIGIHAYIYLERSVREGGRHATTGLGLRELCLNNFKDNNAG